ncbi:hypothetical protein J3A83DRAFT_4186142 [Scleroderma citrinum]
MVKPLHRVALEKGRHTSGPTVLQKHKRADDAQPRWMVQCLNDGEEGPQDNRYDPLKYLALPMEEEQKECYHKFYEATSSSALVAVSICQACLDELHKPGDKPPQYSLANGCSKNVRVASIKHLACKMPCKAINCDLHWTQRTAKGLDSLYLLSEAEDIVISTSHLAELPEDNIPEEIIDIICQLDDVGVIEQESAGYVPQDDDEASDMVVDGSDNGPDVIPIQIAGGIDTDMSKLMAKKVALRVNEKLLWNLRHSTSPFVAFGITQCHQVLSSTHLQIGWKTFDKDTQLLSTLTLERLQKAWEAEEKNIPVMDPLIQLLQKHVFASENINLNDLWEKRGPSKEKQAENMASNPYAASKFFHFLIWTILTTLFGIKATTHHVHMQMRIFGGVAGYVGLIKSQGRGTLHLHLLVWLRNMSVSGLMEELLCGEDFHQKVQNFIKENIHAYIPGFKSAEELRKIPNNTEVAYSQPPNPQSPNYDSEIVELECKVA